jgi:hypothetical protein
MQGGVGRAREKLALTRFIFFNCYNTIPEYHIETKEGKVKKFAFVSDAAEKEYKDFPDEIQDEFGKNLRIIQFEQEPLLPIKYLSSIGSGVISTQVKLI